MTRFIVLLIVFSLGTVPELAAEQVTKSSEEILTEIRKELIEVDRQFEGLRQDIFFPKNDEVLFYLRTSLKEEFPASSVQLFVNNKPIYTHQYTDSEKIAFHFSSLQPLSRTELTPGVYPVLVRLNLNDPNKGIREHRFTVEKRDLPRFVEIELSFDKKTKNFVLAEKVW